MDNYGDVLDMLVSITFTDGREIRDFVKYAMHEFAELTKREGAITVEKVEVYYA